MPVWNACETVAAAVKSIRSQSFEAWELIAVDDGSEDGTREWLDTLAVDKSRLRVVSLTHGGIARALNAGLAHCRAPYVARMDADDVSLPERLELQCQFLDEHPDVGLVGTCVAYGGDREQQQGYAEYVDWSNALVTEDAIRLNRFVESPFAHPSVMFRRSLIEEWGGYSEKEEPEDYELWLRWFSHEVKMAKLPQVLFQWNDLPGRLSRVASQYSVDAFFRCKARYLAQWFKDNEKCDVPLFVWGAGRVTRKRAEWLCDYGLTIAGYVDIDAKKVGQRLGGREVIACDDLPEAGKVFVLSYVSSRGARDKIEAYLIKRGYRAGCDYWLAA